MPSIEKSHDTGMRIIEVLRILLDEDVDKSEIITRLKENRTIGNALTTEAYIKYFNTFEELGLKINKFQNKFCLQNAFFSIDLSQGEKDVLFKLIQSVSKLNNCVHENIITNFLIRLEKYVHAGIKEELKRIENAPKSESIKINIINTLKRAYETQSAVDITVKHRSGIEEILNIEIKKMTESKGRLFIQYRNSQMQRNRRVYIDSIEHVQQSNNQIQDMSSTSTVIFELYGRLAKSYKLRDWEILDNFGENFIRVINTQEEYETLMYRLLKYGENCKIIKPDSFVSEFLSLTNDILLNLREPVCPK